MLLLELTAIWNAVPKVPPAVDPGKGSAAAEDKTNTAGFIRAYRNIGILFKEEDDTTLAAAEVALSVVKEERKEEWTQEATAAAAAGEAEGELQKTFAALGDNTGNTSSISLSQLRQWNEIALLIKETLGEQGQAAVVLGALRHREN